MNSTLVVFFLAVQSSYAADSEKPATDEAFDTVQFFKSDSGAWRIRTCATDQDVHVWSLGKGVEDIVGLALANTEKHFGDILLEGYILRTEDGIEGLRQELVLRGLTPHLEVSDAGFLFWAPPDTRYRSKSKPRNCTN